MKGAQLSLQGRSYREFLLYLWMFGIAGVELLLKTRVLEMAQRRGKTDRGDVPGKCCREWRAGQKDPSIRGREGRREVMRGGPAPVIKRHVPVSR